MGLLPLVLAAYTRQALRTSPIKTMAKINAKFGLTKLHGIVVVVVVVCCCCGGGGWCCYYYFLS